jgi:superoxide dismutase, Fe-Mn family
MANYEEVKFNIPELKGISQKTTDTHLKLYSGYVKHTNLILDQINELGKDSEKNSYAIGELQRRFGFEFDGMRNHEYFFKQFEGGSTAITPDGTLYQAIVQEWGSFETWLNRFKAIGQTRGIGWAILYHDPIANKLVNSWVDEQHLGHLTSLRFILGLDMWEHSYLMDYAPGEKKNYIDAFFENLNWKVVEDRFQA